MLGRLRGAWANYRRAAAVDRFFRTTFANAGELLASYRDRTPCQTATPIRGGVIRHPHRAGLAQTLVEIWHDEVYTGAFYRPRPGDVLVDAGANVGLFSLWAARLCPGCKVLAFEPFAENHGLLTANLQAAGASNVTAFRAGLSGTAGTASMTDGGGRSLDHQLTAGGDIPTHSFADVLASAGGSVALFKCDIEGSEHDLFTAAPAEALAAVGRYAIEYHDNLRPGTLDLLKKRLGERFDVRVVPGGPEGYGMLYAVRNSGG